MPQGVRSLAILGPWLLLSPSLPPIYSAERRPALRICARAMRIAVSVLVCAVCALVPAGSRAGRGVRGEISGKVPLSAISELRTPTQEAEGFAIDLGVVDVGRQQDTKTRDEDSSISLQSTSETDPTFGTFKDNSPDSDSNDSDGEKDFASNPTPISEGRRRAGLLAILVVITLTSIFGYHAYVRREHLKQLLSSVSTRIPSLPFSMDRLKYTSVSSNIPNIRFGIPTLSIPTLSLSAPQKSRRRRLRRPKSGFRVPGSISRSRTWADAEAGLLYDYDYDGDYERGRPRYGYRSGSGHDHSGSGSSSSSSSDSYAQEAEAFDLGADEDFMIGAPRRLSLSPTASAQQGSLRKGMGSGMGQVWGRWKRSSGGSTGKAGRKGRRASVLSIPGSGSHEQTGSGAGTVLFAVAEGDDDLELELETDEALPLAPTPHRFSSGLGLVKGYGSAG